VNLSLMLAPGGESGPAHHLKCAYDFTRLLVVDAKKEGGLDLLGSESGRG